MPGGSGRDLAAATPPGHARFPAVMQPLRRRAAGPLENPAYRRLLTSTLVAYGARFLDMTMLSWLVVQRTEDPLPIALLSFFRFAPFLAAGPAVGFVADRFPRLRVMRGAQAGLAALAASMAVLLWTGQMEVWHAYLYVLCQGSLFVLDATSRRSYMAGTVGTPAVTAALSIDMLGMTVARILFANVGGLLLEASRPRWAYVALAAMALASALLTRGLPTLFRNGDPARREAFLESLRGGVRFARDQRLIVGGLVLVALANLTGFVYEPMVPAVADEVFDADPTLFGLFMSATGVGSLLTSLWLSLSGTRLRRPGLSALVAIGVLHGLQVVFSYADTPATSLALLVAIGAVGMVFSISHSSLFLVVTPDALRGRVLGLQTLMIGAYPVSNLIVGWLGNQLGALGAVRAVALAGMAWVVLLSWWVPELRQEVVERDDEPGASAPPRVAPAA
jgi:predicted MFS family arabinose efflux permease